MATEAFGIVVVNIPDKPIIISNEMKGHGVFMFFSIIRNTRVVETPRPLLLEMQNAVNYVLETFKPVERLRDHPLVKAYRGFMWSLGIDPTKVRPSSEALVRRIINKGSLPRINSIVDAGNLVSCKTLVPIGIYDLDVIKMPLVLRLSSGGEEFRPIGGKPSTLKKGLPILVDSLGRVIHLYPYRDSEVSMVRETTRNILIIGAGVKGVSHKIVEDSVKEVASLVRRFSGGESIVEAAIVQ